MTGRRLPLRYLLHVLRNPWGYGDEELREVRLAAADLLEDEAKRLDRIATHLDLEAPHSPDCREVVLLAQEGEA